MDILGKPMLQRVYERVSSVNEFSDIVVATDDHRIYDFCKQNNIHVEMTSSSHRTAANRLQELSDKCPADFYIQLNGDEPLIDINAIRKSIPDFIPDDIEFGTNIITKILDPAQVLDPSNIKMVFDDNMRCIYMSRSPIPFPFMEIDYSYYKHVGIIGYNKKMLDFYKNSKPGRFELIEGIDTLRFLDYGKILKLYEVDNCKTLSVDTQKDLEMVRKIFSQGFLSN